jgi:hypothetical protein
MRDARKVLTSFPLFTVADESLLKSNGLPESMPIVQAGQGKLSFPVFTSLSLAVGYANAESKPHIAKSIDDESMLMELMRRFQLVGVKHVSIDIVHGSPKESGRIEEIHDVYIHRE